MNGISLKHANVKTPKRFHPTLYANLNPYSERNPSIIFVLFCKYYGFIDY